MISRHRTHKPPLQGFLLGLLLCAWMAAQTLGLMHRELHGGLASAAGSGLSSIGAQPSAAAAGEPASLPDKAGFLTGLFSQHTQSSDCKLYDHAGLADAAACPVALHVPLVFQAGAPALRPAFAVLFEPVPFQARGPPSLR